MKHLLREMRPTLPQTAMAIGHILETENEGYDGGGDLYAPPRNFREISEERQEYHSA